MNPCRLKHNNSYGFCKFCRVRGYYIITCICPRHPSRRFNDVRILTGAVGLGALTGALEWPRRKQRLVRPNGVGGNYFWSRAFSGFICGQSIWQWRFCFCRRGTMLIVASSNTIIQTVADDDKRGRVISFYTSFPDFFRLAALFRWLAKIFGVRLVGRRGFNGVCRRDTAVFPS